jgi:hypothetical protein
MNGRMYDPRLGRFLSPDPFVQAPNYTQSYNRYSYVWNNPMKYVDPSGYTAEEPNAIIITDREHIKHIMDWLSGNGSGSLIGEIWSFISSNDYGSEGYFGINSDGEYGTWVQYATPATGQAHTAMQNYLGNNKFLGFDLHNVFVPLMGNIKNPLTPWTSFIGIIGQAGLTPVNGRSIYVVRDAALAAMKEVQVGKVIRGIGITGTRIGWVGEGISIVVNGINLLEKPTPGNLGRFVVSIGIAATNAVPTVGPVLSFGLSAYEAGGGFDGLYLWLDK